MKLKFEKFSLVTFKKSLSREYYFPVFKYFLVFCGRTNFHENVGVLHICQQTYLEQQTWFMKTWYLKHTLISRKLSFVLQKVRLFELWRLRGELKELATKSIWSMTQVAPTLSPLNRIETNRKHVYFSNRHTPYGSHAN